MNDKKKRHITVTGFVVQNNSTLLHWHNKVKEWLPPGGHLEINEDPVQALLREIKEETGLEVTIIPTQETLPIANLEQLQPPFTIMVENIEDNLEGPHQHIDLIYFVKPINDYNIAEFVCNETWTWVSKEQLLGRLQLTNGEGTQKSPPDDVIKLGVKAISFYNA